VEGAAAWVVRQFTRYLVAFDPGTEIPPARLLPSGRRRPAPFLYSEADISALMTAARGVGLPLRSATLETVIGCWPLRGSGSERRSASIATTSTSRGES